MYTLHHPHAAQSLALFPPGKPGQIPAVLIAPDFQASVVLLHGLLKGQGHLVPPDRSLFVVSGHRVMQIAFDLLVALALISLSTST
jgi:hypothetical protein